MCDLLVSHTVASAQLIQILSIAVDYSLQYLKMLFAVTQSID